VNSEGVKGMVSETNIYEKTKPFGKKYFITNIRIITMQNLPLVVQLTKEIVDKYTN
jgi:hypothetical protein